MKINKREILKIQEESRLKKLLAINKAQRVFKQAPKDDEK